MHAHRAHLLSAIEHTAGKCALHHAFSAPPSHQLLYETTQIHICVYPWLLTDAELIQNTNIRREHETSHHMMKPKQVHVPWSSRHAP